MRLLAHSYIFASDSCFACPRETLLGYQGVIIPASWFNAHKHGSLLGVLTRFQIGFRNICREAIANLNIGEHPCCIAGDVFIRECKPFPNRDAESWAVGLPLVASGLRPLCLSSIMSLTASNFRMPLAIQVASPCECC